MDSAHTSNGSDAVCRPGFALAGGQAHSVERRGDMFVRPAAGHAPHHRQRVFCRRTAMFPRPRLTHPQLGVLASTPMDREDDIACVIIDIDDDVGDQRPEQLLASTHRDTGRSPGRRQILRQVGEGVRVDGDIRSPFGGTVGLQISDAPERGLPALFQLRGNEAIVRIAGRVATLGQACLVAGLLHFQVPDTLLVFLMFPVHPLRLERGIDRHWFHHQQQLSADRGIDPRAAEGHAAR